MIGGRYPFKEATINDTKYKPLITKDFKSFWKAVDKGFFSDMCKDLIQKMLAYNPKERIILSDIVNHDWFTEERIYSSGEEIMKSIE